MMMIKRPHFRLLLGCTVTAAGGFGLGAMLYWLGAPVWLMLLTASVCSAVAGVLYRQGEAVPPEEADSRLLRERSQHEATRQFIQRVLDVIPMPIYVKDADSRILLINRAQAEYWGFAVDDLIGIQSFTMAEGINAVLTQAEDRAILAGEHIYKEEHLLPQRGHAEEFRVIAKTRCEGPQGEPVIVCARFDTTRWRLAEREVKQALEREVLLRRRNQEFIQRVINVIPDPFYIKDRHGRIVMVNEAFAREREMSCESLIGMPATKLDARPDLAADTAQEDEEVLRGAVIDKEQHYAHPRTGEERFRHVSKRSCDDIDGQPVIVVAHFNITRWKVAERKVARMAHEDELTGLPNRRRFLAEAERMMSSATRHGLPLALIMFDIDHFKKINDAHGHVVGDHVLRELARRVIDKLRTEDLPCRWGGEEFAVLLPNTLEAAAVAAAERLREAVAAAPMVVGELILKLSISGGIAQLQPGESLNEFMTRADAALYAAKHAGRNCFLPA
ncbi:diguanylate cyclase [Uliginosibacterium sediminicola]|uniref:diguanylate cyclase n=1 Tax=Uliginosibacterium sediminicola TaxID=2024550 RepID=A0ABU9YY32_9RHOO